MTPIRRILLPLLIACAGSLPAQEASSLGLPPFRILMLPGAGNEHPGLTDTVIRDLGETVRQAGFPVLDRTQAEALAQRQQAVMRAWLEDKGAEGESALALMSRCEVVIRVTATPGRLRKQQGRYVARVTANYSIAYVDSAESLGVGEATGDGRSMESFDEAIRTARKDLVGAADRGLGGGLVAALETARSTERRKGPRLTIALYGSQDFAELLAEVGASLETAPGVVPGSFQPMSTFPTGAFAQGGQGICSEITVRCSGGVMALQQAAILALRRMGEAIEEQRGIELRPVVLASGRRLDVILRAAPGGLELADEVQRVVDDSVVNMYGRYGDILSGKRVAVLPASIADTSHAAARLHTFRRAFATEYDKLERELQREGQTDLDPLDVERTVAVADGVFGSLSQAKAKLIELEEAFYASNAGSVAEQIGQLVESSLRAAAGGAVAVQPTTRARDRAVDFIRLEAAASIEEGSINPDTVAFYRQEGTQFMVSTRLRRFLDEYTVSVDVIDLGSGVALQGSSSFHPRFTPVLQEQLGS